MNQMERVIDVGTGAGFPGIPLKIAFPHLDMVLLDSLKKRVFFLDEVIAQLNLKMVQVIHGRAEDYAGQKEYRETFDLSVSRAVANLSPLSEYCLPFTAVAGKFIAYKSGKVEGELKESEKAIQTFGGKVFSCVHFPLFDTDVERSFVVVEKVKATPLGYPRKAGLPVKNPI
jgi:16S rRNA (guanine527-N7)-methyltransferase